MKKLFLIFLCVSFSACLSGQKALTNQNAAVKIDDQTAAANIENLLKKQILLTNDAEFSGGRTLEGASGFLISYQGANYAVTARHLLGEAGGVEPELKIGELGASLTKWEMMPRIVGNHAQETIELGAKNLDFSQSDSDIVLLKVISGGSAIEPLTPDFNLPAVGETLFLIGCPYSETKCRQNSYPAKFVEYDEAEKSLVLELDSAVKLSGFSGAPIVNGTGKVVGILSSGFMERGKAYTLATHIKEIEKIKF